MAKASKFLGNIDNHRATHDGVCGDENKDLPNIKYFCASPNATNPQFNQVCNPITYQDTKIQKCLNDLNGVDVLDTIKEDSTTTSSLSQDEKIERDNNLKTCITKNRGAKIITPDISTKDNKKLYLNTDDIHNKKLNELDELNYFIEPAKNSSGKLLKSDTYFHVHEHKHP